MHCLLNYDYLHKAQMLMTLQPKYLGHIDLLIWSLELKKIKKNSFLINETTSKPLVCLVFI